MSVYIVRAKDNPIDDEVNKMGKIRNLEYEKKFRAYLFSFDYETHKQICKNINVNHKGD